MTSARPVQVRKGRLVALLSAVTVTGTAVVGALVGAGSTASYAAVSPGDGPDAAAVLAESRTADPSDAGPTDADRASDPEGVRLARSAPLPARSGHGKRVVFDQSEQRVWLVDAADRVRRTYLVSGSLHDNLDPGTYAVYSRSPQAWAYDGSGTMRWMVRFTQGDTAAIGFHDIPLEDGEPAQTRAQLGTPQSSGCIRQMPADAKALWRFAPDGTTVVVTA